jgi:hypothetical protein
MRRWAVLLCWVPGLAWGWGPHGHRVVGELAERQVSAGTLAELRRLLPGAGLAEVSNWADEVRNDPRWRCANPLHYVTVPEQSSWTEPPTGGDALATLIVAGDALADRSRPDAERALAVRWLVHLVGDLHQPLHVGLGCDRGGNSVPVSYFGRPARLHEVWDELVLDDEVLSFTDKTNFLQDLSSAERSAQVGAGPLSWADEAQALLPVVYQSKVDARCTCSPCELPSESTPACVKAACASFALPLRELSYPYRDVARGVIDGQLRRAGVRLASLLDALIGAGGWPAAWQAQVAAVRAGSSAEAGPRTCLFER